MSVARAKRPENKTGVSVCCPATEARVIMYTVYKMGRERRVIFSSKGGINMMNKEERIQIELDRISKVFDRVPEKERSVIDPLLQNYAFMKVTLEDLQEEINRDGIAETYQNGANQSGQKENSKLKSYNRLIKNFESVIKTVMKYLPDDDRIQKDRLDPMEMLLQRIESGLDNET